jgi:hypothetical protein
VLLALVITAASAAAQVVARCGDGYLERIDGQLVLHVKGTPYEMGYQHGALLRDQCLSLMHELFEVKAREASIEVFGKKVTPQSLIRVIYEIQSKYVPQRYVEEMRGLADALGVAPEKVYTANSIPELFHCSGFALLKDVTTVGSLLHGRVLDYGVDWRLQEHAVLVIARPRDRIPFVNVTYAGFIGSVSGMNREQISIGEMGGRGLGKWVGTPMAMLVRRVLEEAHSLDEAIAVFRDSRRTCEYYYVIGDARRDSAVGLNAGADVFEMIRPGEAHPRLPTPVPQTVLLSANERYANLCRIVRQQRETGGKFTVEAAIRLMEAPVAMKSNLHNVLFAPGLGKLWVAHASTDGKPAWTQPYHEFDFWTLLSRPVAETGRVLPAPPSRTEPATGRVNSAGSRQGVGR